MHFRFPHLFFVLVLVLLTGCKKETTEPEPAPLPVTVRMTRTLVYQNGTTQMKADYENAAMEHAATQTADRLTLGFRAKTPLGGDGLTLVLPKAKQKTGLVGQYSLGTLPNPATGDASVDYRLGITDTRAAIFLSTTTKVEGSLEITAYDTARKTLSGSYTVVLPGAYDPYDTAPLPEKRVTITITGTFQNVVVKNEP